MVEDGRTIFHTRQVEISVIGQVYNGCLVGGGFIVNFKELSLVSV